MVDINLTLATALEDIIMFQLLSTSSKPGDGRAWEALGRLDAMRRQLQRDAGVEPTELVDPHGRVWYDKEDKEKA